VPSRGGSEPKRKLRWVLLLLAVAGLIAQAAVSRVRQHARLQRSAVRAAEPLRVVLVSPQPPSHEQALVLPGTVEALRQTSLFARTNGYLQQRLVDIGDRVTAGQLLAVIETPELDQQLEQARANREQAQATLEQGQARLELARISLQRIRVLSPRGFVAPQDLDDKQAAYHAAVANVRAAQANIAQHEANIHRLRALKGFARVTAPFAGTITERRTEIGSLITAGNGAGQALFTLAQSNPVRVMVAVPQGLTQAVQQGGAAWVSVRDFPGRPFAGKVTRDAHALDVGSRTLLTEVQVPNDDGALRPGMYAQVTLQVARPRPWLLLDASALLLTAGGPQVAVLGPDARIHLRQVFVDVDFGPELAISQGISVTDRIVKNPDSRLKEGTPAQAAN
jgi:RND family efflux transporter MFP subunit